MKEQEHSINKTEQKRAFVIKFFYLAIIAFLIYGIVKYALPVLAPFLIAGLIACILNRPICLLSEKTHIKRAFICIPVVVLFFVIVSVVFGAAGTKIVEGMKTVAAALPSVFTEIVFPFLETAADKLDGLLSAIRPETGDIISIIMESLGEGIRSTYCRGRYTPGFRDGDSSGSVGSHCPDYGKLRDRVWYSLPLSCNHNC